MRAMPDLFVTSGTGLTLMPECRWQMELLTTGKNADAGLTFFPAQARIDS
jgi:hypothetical protein